MKKYFLVALTVMLTSCFGRYEKYILTAHNADSQNTSSKKIIVRQGSIFRAREAICLRHPQAIIRTQDYETKKNVALENPYYCSQELITSNKTSPSNKQQISNIIPKKISLFSRDYKLSLKQNINKYRVYEYLQNDETIKNWTSIVSLSYLKGINFDQNKWKTFREKSLKTKQIKTIGNNTIVNDFFEIEASPSFYTVYVEKSIHKKACNGISLMKYEKKYQKKPSEKTIKNTSKAIEKALLANTWLPDCSKS